MKAASLGGGRAEPPGRRLRLVALLVGTVVGSGVGTQVTRAACTTAICPAFPSCTIVGTHDLGAKCILDFSTKNVTVGQNAVLRTQAAGSLEIRAKTLALNGTLRASGGDVTVRVGGDFTMAGAKSFIDTATSTPGVAGVVEITAAGRATIGKVVTKGVGDGGDVFATAKSVVLAGPVRAEGTDGAGGRTGEGGIVLLDADEDIDVTGTLSANAGGKKYADGGDIHIDLGGDFRVAPTGIVSATGVSGGSGGRLYVYAWGGATMDGKLLFDGAGPDATGGDIGLYPSKAVGTAGTWSANGGNGPGAYGGTIDVAVDSYTGGASFASTNALSMRATAGGGGQGGDINLEGSADLTVRGKLDVSAGGTGSRGGWIWVGSAIGGRQPRAVLVFRRERRERHV
jgi:hypothetical protein